MDPSPLKCSDVLKVMSNTSLVLGTIAKITSWCGFQLVDVEISTISDCNVNGVSTII